MGEKLTKQWEELIKKGEELIKKGEELIKKRGGVNITSSGMSHRYKLGYNIYHFIDKEK